MTFKFNQRLKKKKLINTILISVNVNFSVLNVTSLFKHINVLVDSMLLWSLDHQPLLMTTKYHLPYFHGDWILCFVNEKKID